MSAEQFATRVSSLSAFAADPRLPALSRLLIKLAVQQAIWVRRVRTRRHLQDLPPELLRDVGLTEAQRERESLKRFWMP